jgi:hypothetical protein
MLQTRPEPARLSGNPRCLRSRNGVRRDRAPVEPNFWNRNSFGLAVTQGDRCRRISTPASRRGNLNGHESRLARQKVEQTPACECQRGKPVALFVEHRSGNRDVDPAVNNYLHVLNCGVVLVRSTQGLFVRPADGAVRKTGECRAKDSAYRVVGHRRAAGCRGGD